MIKIRESAENIYRRLMHHIFADGNGKKCEFFGDFFCFFVLFSFVCFLQLFKQVAACMREGSL